MASHRRTPSHLVLFSILIFRVVFLGSNLSAQTFIDMDWCFADGGGFELRDGRIVGVNLAEIDINAEKSNLFELHNLEYLRLSNTALHSLGARAITKNFANLNELSIRYSFNEDIEKSSVALTEYRHLLTLPRLKTITIELLNLAENGTTPTPLIESPIEHLDAAIHLQSSLSNLLEGLHLKKLRLQLLKKSRAINIDDLDVINKQINLESFSFVGRSNVSFVESSNGAEPAKIDFSKLKGLSRLKELSLYNVDFDPAELMRFPQLKLLKIRECRFESSSFEVLFQHPSLAKVVVIGCSNNDLGLSKPLIPAKSKLKQIDLEMTPLSELETFAKVNCDLRVTLGSMNGSRALERFSCSIGHVTKKLTELELDQLFKLKNLSGIEYTGFTSTTESAIMQLSSIPTLRSLSIIGTNIRNSTWNLRGNHRAVHLQHISLLTYPGPTSRLISELLNSDLISLSINSSFDRKKRPGNRWQGVEIVSLPKLEKLYLTDFSFPRDQANLPAQFIPKSLKHISLDRCELNTSILTRILSSASHLEQFQVVMGYFYDDVDLSILNNSLHLKRVDLFDSKVSAEVAFNLKAKHVRVGGAEMFSW